MSVPSFEEGCRVLAMSQAAWECLPPHLREPFLRKFTSLYRAAAASDVAMTHEFVGAMIKLALRDDVGGTLNRGLFHTLATVRRLFR